MGCHSGERVAKRLSKGTKDQVGKGKEENKRGKESIYLLCTMLNKYTDQTLLAQFFIKMTKKDLNYFKVMHLFFFHSYLGTQCILKLQLFTYLLNIIL